MIEIHIEISPGVHAVLNSATVPAIAANDVLRRILVLMPTPQCVLMPPVRGCGQHSSGEST
jgi:hypothetical protein